MPRRPGSCRGELLAAVLALLLAVSCGEDTVTRPLRVGVGGRLSGHVTGAKGPLPGSIWIESIVRDSGGPETIIQGAVNDDGGFSVDVPAGRYFVGLRLPSRQTGYPFGYDADVYWSRSRLTQFHSRADTIAVSVGSSVEAIDFSFGRLEATVEIPTEWLGFRVDAYSVSQWTSLFREYRLVTVSAESPMVEIEFDYVIPGIQRVFLQSGYRDAASGESGWAELWLPNSLREENADSLEVRAGETVARHWRIVGQRLDVSGLIDGAWSALGLYPPSVVLWTGDSLFVRIVDVDDEGKFATTLWARQALKVALQAERTIDHLGWIGGDSFGSATLFTPPSDGRLENLRYTDAAIEMVVSDPDLEFFHTKIEVTDRSGHPLGEAGAFRSDGVFHAVFSCLQPGSYFVRAVPGELLTNPWRAQWYDRAANLSEATPVVVPSPGAITRAEVTWERGAEIRGQVRDSAGAMVPSYVVFVTGVDSDAVLGDGRFSDESEGYRLQGLSPGRYRVAALHGYRISADFASDLPESARWYPSAPHWSDGSVITIQDAETIEGIDLVLP